MLIRPCLCLFHNNKENVSISGSCIFTCFYPPDDHDLLYSINVSRALNSSSQFNYDMCNSVIPLHRTGRFCGQCEPGYGLAVYSYDTTCIKCNRKGFKHWLQYSVMAYGPLTLFYITMVTFRVSLPTSHLNGILFVIQCISSPMQVRVIHLWTQTIPLKYKTPMFLIKTIFSLIGLSNLDLFRELYPPLCLNPRHNILHVISLDLLVAVYPFFLILVTTCLVSLYDKNCRPVVSAWQGYKRLLGPLLKSSVRVSLVETFAMFLLLSSAKIMGLCYDLLTFSTVYQEDGSKGNTYVFYDPTIAYFSNRHRPYALLAIILSFFFCFLPFILLLVYPLRTFHKILNRFNMNSRVLHVFMDAFQGAYKSQPLDMRYFAAWYLLLRFLFFLFVGYFDSVLAMTTACFVMILGASSVAIFRPYKNPLCNIRDTMLWLSAALFYLFVSAVIDASLMDYGHLSIAQITVILSILFIIFMTLASLAWLQIFSIGRKLYFRVKHIFSPRNDCQYEELS